MHFLGYANNHKGYKCLSKFGRICISRHVNFDEQLFPCPSLFGSSASTSSTSTITFNFAPCIPTISSFESQNALAAFTHPLTYDSNPFFASTKP